MEANEVIRAYLLNEFEEEERRREAERNEVNKAVELERQSILAAIAKDKRIAESRKKKLREFWDETYEIYGPDVLETQRPENVENAVQELEEDLRDNLQNTIVDIMNFELDMMAQFKEMQENEGQYTETYEEQRNEYEEAEDNEGEDEEANSEQYETSPNNEERYRTSEQNRSSREDNRHFNQRNVSEVEQGQETEEGQREQSEQVAFQTNSPQSPSRPNYFYPKYVTKREKMERLMKSPGHFDVKGGVNSPGYEKKVEEYRFQQRGNASGGIYERQFERSGLPEEKGTRITDEPRFVEDLDQEDLPRKLRVSMASPDADEISHPQGWFGRSKVELNRPTYQPLENIYDEKSFIKKNIDNYQTFEPEEAKFFAKNVFEDMNVREGHEKDVILERLKQRYENAYRENFLIDRNETRQIEKAKSRRVNLPDVPFLSEEQMKENKLLATLKSSSNANALRNLDRSITSESFNEFKNVEEERERGQASRRSRIRYNESSVYREKRYIPLFDQFEREIFEVSSALPRSPKQAPTFGSKELSSASTHKSMFFQRPKTSPETIEQIENFILDLHRTLSSNSGTVPQKYQKRLQEIVNARPTQNKYFEVKKANKEDNLEEAEGEEKNSEFMLVKDRLASVSQELSNKTLDALKPQPDHKLRKLLWSCLLALQANFDESIALVNQHVVVKFEKIVQYASQPGKALLQLRALTNRLRKDEIKRTLYDDFQNLFGEIEEELSVSKLDDEAEKLLLKYIYFVKRYIEVLDKDNRLRIINNRQQKIVTNQRMNQKYLEVAERRKALEEEAGGKPDQEMYGINFTKWEENLKAIAKENKMLGKYNEEKKRKEENLKKLEEKKKQKEEEAKVFEKNKEEAEKERLLKERQQKIDKEEKKKKFEEKVALMKTIKEEKKKVIKEIHQEDIKKTEHEIKFKAVQKQKEKEQLKDRHKEQVKKLVEKKEQRMSEKKTSEQAQKEEQVWRKAQELFEKQRKLLQERDKLHQHLKLMGK